MNKYLSRITSSARGETFNPLIWPSLISTLIYGIGFSVFFWTDTVHLSSLFSSMSGLHPLLPVIWGAVAVLTIALGLSFLLFNKPPYGKVSGLIGFMVWSFAAWCYILTGAWFVALAVAFPNIWFWVWQYLSLARFKQEEKDDAETARLYRLRRNSKRAS